jgi:periplasmic protein TonB
VSVDEPLARVLGLDTRASGMAAWLGYGSTSVVLLEGLAGLALLVAWARPHAVEPAMPVQQAEIQTEDMPAPPLETLRHAAAVQAPRLRSHTPPAPATAHLDRVLAQDPRLGDPLNLTGLGPGHVGTGPEGPPGPGTGDPNVPRLVDPPGGAPPLDPRPRAPVSTALDRSRPACLGGAGEWRCPFPPEADIAQVDDAFVTLQVDVAPNGAPSRVQVLSDPGNGFGREARRCAMGERYVTALDRDGTRVAGTTRPFRVHFSR